MTSDRVGFHYEPVRDRLTDEAVREAKDATAGVHRGTRDHRVVGALGDDWRLRLGAMGRGGSGKVGDGDATQNGQSPSIVIASDAKLLDEVAAMKVRIEYCVP